MAPEIGPRSFGTFEKQAPGNQVKAVLNVVLTWLFFLSLFSGMSKPHVHHKGKVFTKDLIGYQMNSQRQSRHFFTRKIALYVPELIPAKDCSLCT